VDVCVVGSGASGLPVATRLAQHGFRVVVLERGPWMRRADFVEDELLVRRGLFWPTVEDEPRTWRPADSVPATRLPTAVQLFANAMVVGGSTVHYSALAWRFRESDFQVLSEDGQVDGAALADWPISYADLEPYYTQAEHELGVSGDARLNPWEPPRSRDYPVPPVPRNSAGAVFERGALAMGLNPFPIPLAILSRDYDGRPGCVGKGFCSSYGCSTGARSSTMETYLPKGLATGRMELRANAFVTGVETDALGRATGVTYIAPDGSSQRQAASIVVLAAGGVETTRLLLLSASRSHPAGLANASGLVGTYLMQHSPPATVVATFPEPIDGHMGTAATRTVMDWYATDASRGYIRGGFAQPRAHGGDPIGYALRRVHPATWGLAHKTSMRETWRHYLYSHVTGESLPVESNRVDLDPDVRDRFGLPVARTTYTPHDNDFRLAKWIADRSAELFDAAGATKVHNAEPVNRKLHNHQMGTARMGDDPSRSVVDRWCRAHDVPNLYIADSSVFVTSAGVNPSLTITALALRVADRIAATRGDPKAQ
jgi:choline dehydrogenase-like flavoprotein